MTAAAADHVRYVLAAEYARCVAQVENADREIEKCHEATELWCEERRKWAERVLALREELGDDIPSIPPRQQSELSDAWEFETR